MNLTGVTVKKIKKSVKKGSTDKFGPWTLHIVWLDDPDWGEVEFSFFEDKNMKVMPEEGKTYAIVEIEERDQGYRIKKFTPLEEKPKPKADKAKPRREGGYQRPAEKVENPISMYFSYAKDLAVALIAKGGKSIDVSTWAMEVAKGGNFMYESAEKAAPTEAIQTGNKTKPQSTSDKSVSIAPLVKAMAKKVIDMNETTAKAILPKTVNAERFNAINDYLKEISEETPIEAPKIIEVIAGVVKNFPIKE